MAVAGAGLPGQMAGRRLFVAALACIASVGAPPADASHGPEDQSARCEPNRIWLGVDYYPEQWPLEDMQADMVAIKDDLGADFIRIGEFMWHEIEPSDGVFNFTLLDTILSIAESVGLEVMLGTPTATMPAWLYTAHPEVFSLGPDSPDGFAAAAPAFGGRRQYSFNSGEYLSYVQRLVKTMAHRYGQRKVVSAWQVDNELGHEGSDLDFSGSSRRAWRGWLNRAHAGDISRLNAAWGTVFWGTTYNGFHEVPLPRWTIPGSSARPNENFRSNTNPGALLDFRRFRRDSIADFAHAQVATLRSEGVGGCVTTNAPGGFWGKALDHNDIFASMDFTAYDNYPVWGGSVEPTRPSRVALALDTVRGWAPGGKGGWMVAEQLIGAQGHDIIGYTPRPGQVRAWAAASLLHGATSLAFFRYRAAVFGQEEFCYGILDHSTPRGTGRKWKEAKQLYSLARDHQRLWLAPVEAQVVLLYDSDNMFAWQAQPQSTQFDFETEAHRLYYPFWRCGAAVDVLSSRKLLQAGRAAEVLSRYRIVLLPAPMLTSDGLVFVLGNFVKSGGSLWIGFRSDLKDERSQIRREPSRLASLAGVEVTEIESLNDVGGEAVKCAVWSTGAVAAPPRANASVWREGLRVLNGSGAQVLWHYSDDFFGKLGYAAATRRQSSLNSSETIYLGAGIDEEALVPLAAASLARQSVAAAAVTASGTLLGASAMLEQALRRDLDGEIYHVAINHGAEALDAGVLGTLEPYEVHITVHHPQGPSTATQSLSGVERTALADGSQSWWLRRQSWGWEAALAALLAAPWILRTVWWKESPGEGGDTDTSSDGEK